MHHLISVDGSQVIIIPLNSPMSNSFRKCFFPPLCTTLKVARRFVDFSPYAKPAPSQFSFHSDVQPFQSSRKWTHDSQEAEETETLLGNPPVCGRLIQNHPRGAGAESVATLQSDAEEVVTVAKNESTSTNSLLILPVAADRSKGKAKATAVESTCQAPTSTGHDDHEWAKTQSHNGIQDVGPAPARQARDEPFIGFAAADTSAVPAVVEPHPIADGTNTAQDPLTPSILGQYICRWDGCSELIIVPVDYEAQVVSDHMKNVHEVDVRSSGPPVSCLWPGCRQRTPYQAHSISRHVLSKRHGNIKYPCDQPGCTRKLGRKDLLARHKNKKHPGWDQVPASGVQNPAPLAAPVTTPSSSTPPPAPPPPPSAQPQPERPLKRRRCGK
ncbi:hypothetical protein OE88DRAFT_1231895 [Heliocybe sulcata]|uniref:C2H2-type domain-containing protein n=1 Tax=Heliocybe sulcata TaxID=5364 RepID=A0A5C3MIV8_9AGAM|nr:hypothetical protein OE88DRAFT_1231895 [Heliocybe sulcata]